MKCLYCKKGEARKKYCSTTCIKKAWYLRTTSSHSLGNRDPLFWDSETGKGFHWEQEGSRLLDAIHLPFNHGGNRADLQWQDKLVDVKSCELYRRKFKRGKAIKKEQSGVWVFHRNGEKLMDYFLCFCLENDIPQKVLLIPSHDFPSSGITIGRKSRYDIYIIPFMEDKE